MSVEIISIHDSCVFTNTYEEKKKYVFHIAICNSIHENYSIDH